MSDDDLHERLAEAAAAAASGAVLPDTHHVRAQGDRRRVRLTMAMAALGVFAVAAVAAGVSSILAPPGLPLDANELGISPGPSGSDIPHPSGGSSPSGEPDPSHSPSSVPTSGPLKFTKIPVSLSMLHEGEAGWVTVNDAEVPSAFNPCGDEDVTQIGRTDARTLRGPGLPLEESHSPSKVTHHLFLYATEQAATAAFIKLSAGGCGWSRAIMNPGDAESTHIASLRKSEPPTQEPGVYWLHDANLVRTKNVLLIAYADASGAGMTSNMADQELGYILKPLCQAQLVCR
jgi:hypothetical protein